MRFGVSVFPGTWSDVDCYSVINDVLGYEVDYVWHKETDKDKYDCIVITGGFSDLFKNSIKTKLKKNKDITINGLIKISKLIK